MVPQDRHGDAPSLPTSPQRRHDDSDNHHRDKTVHSRLFDRGYSLKELKVFSTENSFITGNIFSRWANEDFLPTVEKKRARLREMMGDFNDNVVLIMDGCSAHKIEPFMEVFAQKRLR